MFYNTLNVQLHPILTAQKDLDKRIRWIMPWSLFSYCLWLHPPYFCVSEPLMRTEIDCLLLQWLCFPTHSGEGANEQWNSLKANSRGEEAGRESCLTGYVSTYCNNRSNPPPPLLPSKNLTNQYKFIVKDFVVEISAPVVSVMWLERYLSLQLPFAVFFSSLSLYFQQLLLFILFQNCYQQTFSFLFSEFFGTSTSLLNGFQS